MSENPFVGWVALAEISATTVLGWNRRGAMSAWTTAMLLLLTICLAAAQTPETVG